MYNVGVPAGFKAYIDNIVRVGRTFGYLGIEDLHGVAAEYDEFADERLQASLAQAERRIEALVDNLAAELDPPGDVTAPTHD